MAVRATTYNPAPKHPPPPDPEPDDAPDATWRKPTAGSTELSRVNMGEKTRHIALAGKNMSPDMKGAMEPRLHTAIITTATRNAVKKGVGSGPTSTVQWKVDPNRIEHANPAENFVQREAQVPHGWRRPPGGTSIVPIRVELTPKSAVIRHSWEKSQAQRPCTMWRPDLLGAHRLGRRNLLPRRRTWENASQLDMGRDQLHKKNP